MATEMHEFRDLTTFLEKVNGERPAYTQRSSDNPGKRSDTWSQSASYQDASGILIDGAAELESKVRAMSHGMAEACGELSESAISSVYDVAGDDVDTGRYLDGDPECMYTVCQTIGRGRRIIRMAVNMAGNCSIPAEYFTRRGCAFMVMADLLEKSGYRVEITVCCGIAQNPHGRGGRKMLVRVPVKEASEPLDLTRLSYMTMHPAMFRRHFFRYMEMLPEADARVYGCHRDCYGYGYAADFAGEVECEVWAGSDNDLSRHFNNLENAKAWIKATIKRLRAETRKHDGYVEEEGKE